MTAKGLLSADASTTLKITDRQHDCKVCLLSADADADASTAA
jgi:hypothetical protein